MPLYEMFKTNESAEKDGVWINYGPNSKGKDTAFRVARAGGGNIRFAKVLEFKLKPYRRQLQAEVIDPEIIRKVMMEVFAEAVVLGWENVEIKEGDNLIDLPFSKENCLRLFKELPDLFMDIQEQASKITIYREELREIDSGN